MKITAAIIFLIALLLIGPVLALWSINTLAEQAGYDFYIHHNFWSYLAAFCLLGLAKGSSK